MSIHNTTFYTEDVFNMSDDENRDFIAAFSNELVQDFDASMPYEFIDDSVFKDLVIDQFRDSYPELKNLPGVITSAIDWDRVIRDITMDYGYFMFGDKKIHYREA